ncbi:ABC transporter substrate-binding protein [Brevibacillus brevis]|uniref:ABC transporter substrate-binding protein n=1 Tax=Brevibacillus brevis TaxID=1393 RepID=UPI001C8E0BDA|nr:extracellular solute-binding protein [Brevibacillus brevis]MBY0087423.1 extracellular solute-binding protein [Brevibacillus brevis]
MRNKLVLKTAFVTGLLALGITGCGSVQEGNSASKQPATNAEQPKKELTLEEITKLAKQEGQVVSVGMPDGWANWKGTWNDLNTKYGLSHTDTDLSSSEEIAKFEAEKDSPTADIGDVGIAFGPIAVEKGLTQPYKTSHWDDIPGWAKDDQGHWLVGYQGTIAVLTDKKLVPNPPKTWNDLLKGDYKVIVDDVAKSNQAQMTVLAAAMAHGGNEENIQPGLDYFAELAKQGRVASMDVRPTNLEKGEVPVALLWDFTALGYRDKIDPNRFEVTILKEGSVVSGYTTIINKYAPHPHAAMLAREYIISDEGQINLARGYARPIRSNVKLPDDVTKKLIAPEQYQNVKPISDYKVWDKTAKQLPQLWQEQVLVHVK